MNTILVLLVVVGSWVCGVLPQPTHIKQHPQDTPRNHTHHVVIEDEEMKVQPGVITLETKLKKDTRMHNVKADGVNVNNNIRRNSNCTRRNSRANQRFHYILKNTEANILEMSKRHPNREKLKTMPGLVRLKQEETSQMNAASSLHSEDCVFECPEAQSLAPCTCDPCTSNINCSMVTSFEQLYDIFHSTYFPEPSFMDFLLLAPLMKNNKATTNQSDTFLANTFGKASFACVRVEEAMELVEVEVGAFAGSEGTLKEITFKWNSALTNFPFTDIGKMDVLDRLEVRGSSITDAPVVPFTPRLTKLFLSDNSFMTTIPKRAFAELPYLMLLDLGFSALQILEEESLYFSAEDVLLFLDHNSIDTIHENTFSGFPPSSLDVSWNELVVLDQKVFQPILDHIIAQQYDSYIDVSYNPLECGTLGWLMEDSFYLSYIFLSDPPCLRLA